MPSADTLLHEAILQRNVTDEQIVFNLRASHHRRFSENGFRILASRFCLLLSRSHLFSQKAKWVILAAVSLYNILHEMSADTYMWIMKWKEGI